MWFRSGLEESICAPQRRERGSSGQCSGAPAKLKRAGAANSSATTRPSGPEVENIGTRPTGARPTNHSDRYGYTRTHISSAVVAQGHARAVI